MNNCILYRKWERRTEKGAHHLLRPIQTTQAELGNRLEREGGTHLNRSSTVRWYFLFSIFLIAPESWVDNERKLLDEWWLEEMDTADWTLISATIFDGFVVVIVGLFRLLHRDIWIVERGIWFNIRTTQIDRSSHDRNRKWDLTHPICLARIETRKSWTWDFARISSIWNFGCQPFQFSRRD